MFQKPMTLNEKCLKFKEMAQTFITSNQEASILLPELEKFFEFKSDNLESSWIPKQIRDGLRAIGVSLHKQRGKKQILILVN
jgi:hypothetical protein